MIDLKGKEFGRLKVIKQVKSNNRHKKWLCQCKCGNKTIVQESNLISNHTKSCGCYNIERAIETNTTHGMSDTRFYQCWRDMLDRTSRKKNYAYELYGGRGIEVCDRWKTFENFMEDMYESYKKHSNKYGEKDTTLDRKDNNGDYKPDNCRWATYKEQALNKRTNKKYLINGKKLTKKEIAEKYNLTYSAINHRIQRGWDKKDWIKPMREQKLNKEDVIKIRNLIHNSNFTHEEIAEKYNISVGYVSSIKSKRVWKHI
ncbi:MAG: hypothetical protein K9K32_07470 [Halanaerobiales bacterium]|nr:hypothetical protein [Halanaerobiales bacterium]